MGNTRSLMYLAHTLIPPECSKCKKRLQPCKSFNDYYKINVEGRNVYVFHGGEYFKLDRQPFKYECKFCLLKPIREQEAAGGRVQFTFTERVETDILTEEVGKVALYKYWRRYARRHGGRIGDLINADHQPPVSSILKARELNLNSRLAEAMLEVATKSSPLDVSLIKKVQEHHGLELPAVRVPAEVHRQFPSSTSPKFRAHLATIISEDDVVGAFKTTILGARPRFTLKDDSRFNNFKSDRMSQTHLSNFENSFQQHSIKMVEKWFNLLRGKGVMTEEHVNEIKKWIDRKGYNDRNDPHREQVSGLL